MKTTTTKHKLNEDTLAGMSVEDAAAKFAGNWKEFRDFAWHEQPEDADKWGIFYTFSRDSGLLDQSNAKVYAKELGAVEFENDVRPETHSHWAAGHVDGFSIRTFDDQDNITPAFEKLWDLKQREADYSVLDDEGYSQLEWDAAMENIKDAGTGLVRDDAPEGWESNVYTWFSDHGYESDIENTDDRGAYPSEESMRAALLALDLLDPDQVTDDEREMQAADKEQVAVDAEPFLPGTSSEKESIEEDDPRGDEDGFEPGITTTKRARKAVRKYHAKRQMEPGQVYHRCGECGHEWASPDVSAWRDVASEFGVAKSSKPDECPKCGSENFKKFKAETAGTLKETTAFKLPGMNDPVFDALLAGVKKRLAGEGKRITGWNLLKLLKESPFKDEYDKIPAKQRIEFWELLVNDIDDSIIKRRDVKITEDQDMSHLAIPTGNHTEEYFFDEVLPFIRKLMPGSLRRTFRGSKLRGKGRKEKPNGLVRWIFDFDPVGDQPAGQTKPIDVAISGSYIYKDDGEWDIHLMSPYFAGTMSYHERYKGDPEADAQQIVKSLLEMIPVYTETVIPAGESESTSGISEVCDLLEKYKPVAFEGEIEMASGSMHKPDLFLEDEYGGQAAVITDDHCYVLCLKGDEGKFNKVHHIFREAFEAMKELPMPESKKQTVDEIYIDAPTEEAVSDWWIVALDETEYWNLDPQMTEMIERIVTYYVYDKTLEVHAAELAASYELHPVSTEAIVKDGVSEEVRDAIDQVVQGEVQHQVEYMHTGTVDKMPNSWKEQYGEAEDAEEVIEYFSGNAPGITFGESKVVEQEEEEEFLEPEDLLSGADPSREEEMTELATALANAGFDDGTDADPYTSLAEYGLLRNPDTSETIFCVDPTFHGLSPDAESSFLVTKITVEDVKEVLDDAPDGFFKMIGQTREDYMKIFAEVGVNDYLASVISDLEAWNGYFTQGQPFDDTIETIRSKFLNTDGKGPKNPFTKEDNMPKQKTVRDAVDKLVDDKPEVDDESRTFKDMVDMEPSTPGRRPSRRRGSRPDFGMRDASKSRFGISRKRTGVGMDRKSQPEEDTATNTNGSGISLSRKVDDKRELTELWKDKLQNVYDSFEEWERYSETYSLAERLGYSSAQEAWDDNPRIQGSTDPADYKKIKEMTEDADVTITNHGSIMLFTPVSEEAKAWVEDNVTLEDWQWMGPAFSVEPRYAHELANGMMDAGLTVESKEAEGKFVHEEVSESKDEDIVEGEVANAVRSKVKASDFKDTTTVDEVHAALVATAKSDSEIDEVTDADDGELKVMAQELFDKRAESLEESAEEKDAAKQAHRLARKVIREMGGETAFYAQWSRMEGITQLERVEEALAGETPALQEAAADRLCVIYEGMDE